MTVSRAAAVSLASLVAACGGMEADPSSRVSSAELSAARPGAVFTMTDDPVSNAVLSFTRSTDGTLAPSGSTSTGGAGSGGGEGVLGSQGSLVLSGDGRFRFAVNGGSDEVSSFRVQGAALELAGRAPSGGSLPVSVAVHGDLVYVVNAGAAAGSAAGISALRLGDDGSLTPIAGSTRPLSAAHPGPAEVAFDDSGETLAVTEKATQTITLYRVGEDGLASEPRPFRSAGQTPFGFAFTRRDDLLVSEAQDGPGTSSASSYRIEDGALELVSASVPDSRTAACWLVATRDGRHALVANAGSGSISSYGVDAHGTLALLAADAALLAGGKPLDLALGAGDRYLYALDAANHAIAAFRVRSDGSLDPLPPQASGLPAHAVGLAAR